MALPLVAHVVYRFDTGGLENGVVNLIDRMTGYRHAVIALTEVVPSFAARLQRDDVTLVSLHKPPGHGYLVYRAMHATLRRLAPDIVHTRNLAALEMQLPAWWAGVAARLHGEHGRDAEDMHGTSRRHWWIRRAFRPFVQRHVALSQDLADYLVDRVHVPRARIAKIINGVDTRRFTPASAAATAGAGQRGPIAGCPFADPRLWLVGTVGRMQTVKAQPLLARAFVAAVQRQPALQERLRLVFVGQGPLRGECEAVLDAAGLSHLAWFAGERNDVPDVMRGLSCFVLPSLAEGISNTILEAMASGLPVLATAVGGNAELIESGRSGELVPAGDVPALAAAIGALAVDSERAASYGRAARARVESEFSLEAMVAAYQALYDGLLARRRDRSV